jgi:hypothetical protein
MTSWPGDEPRLVALQMQAQQEMSIEEVRSILREEGIDLSGIGIMSDAYNPERIIGHGRVVYRNGAMEIDVHHPQPHPAPLDPIQQSILYVDLFEKRGIPIRYIRNSPANVSAIERDVNRLVEFVAKLRAAQSPNRRVQSR